MTPKKKDKTGKTRWALVGKMGYALNLVVKTMEFGATEYGVDGWLLNEPMDNVEAAMRHLWHALRDPSAKDRKSGLPHLAHVAVNCLMALELVRLDEEVVIARPPDGQGELKLYQDGSTQWVSGSRGFGKQSMERRAKALDDAEPVPKKSFLTIIPGVGTEERARMRQTRKKK